MNLKDMLKTALASIGSAVAAGALDVMHTHRTGEPLDLSYMRDVAILSAIIGLGNLFAHPPGGPGVTVTTRHEETLKTGSATATSTTLSTAQEK